MHISHDQLILIYEDNSNYDLNVDLVACYSVRSRIGMYNTFTCDQVHQQAWGS